MRTRQEIEKDASTATSPQDTTSMEIFQLRKTAAILEVLLDIRDLLIKDAN